MKLIIKEPGYSFVLPRMGIIRTPCKLNVDGCSISLIITTLKSQGITSYKLVEEPNIKKTILPEMSKVINKKVIKTETVIQKVIINDLSELVKLNRRFKNLEEGLDNIQHKLDNTSNLNKIKNPTIEELTDENIEFIPEISLDGMQMSKNNQEIQIDIDNDILANVDILRDLNGEK